ncbi:hypothetical protein BJX99DRAFT_255144 [Aspergillus californicus]
MGKSFDKIHASSVGSFEHNTSKIAQWVIANGGIHSKNISNDTTHLITTREAFEQDVPAVTEAKSIGTINIVSYDWLTSSLLSKGSRPRAAKPYLWENILKEEKRELQEKKNETKMSQAKKGQVKKGQVKKTQAKTRQTKKRQLRKGQLRKSQTKKAPIKEEQPKEEQTEESQIEQGHPAGSRTAGERKHKLTATKKKGRKRAVKSRDPFDDKPRTPKAQIIASRHGLYEVGGVTYSATLTRLSAFRNTREKVQLKICETIKSPHTYATHIRYSRHGMSRTEMLAPIGSSLDTAMSVFKELFSTQTGKEWEDRFDGIAPTPRKDDDGTVQPPWKGWFFFDTGPESLPILLRDGKI